MVDDLGLVLSVVMPAKNAEKTIAASVKSALRAMPRSSELLVLLDDCSDRTLEVLESFRDDRLVILNPGGRFGITNARNYLLDKARGKYMGVLDADDIALPWRFKAQIRLMERGLDIVCGTAWVFGRRLRPLPLVPQLPLSISPSVMPLALLCANPIVHSTVLMRTSRIKDLGGYPATWPKEDYNLWLKAALSGASIYRSPLPITLYRFHQNQTTQSSSRTWDSEIINQVEQDRIFLARKLSIPTSVTEAKKVLYKISPWLRVEHFGLGGLNSRKVKE